MVKSVLGHIPTLEIRTGVKEHVLNFALPLTFGLFQTSFDLHEENESKGENNKTSKKQLLRRPKRVTTTITITTNIHTLLPLVLK